MTTTRKIGNSNVHPIGFGAMGISAFYGKTDPDEERFKVLDAAYEMGSRHWDTAAVYNDSEELLGKWLKKTGKRNDIFLATKVPPFPKPRGDPEYIRQSLDTSLSRLGVPYVDLYYIHRIDKNIPIEISIRALAEEVKAGRIKNIGLSECSSETLRRAHAVHPIAAVQIEYSPFVLDIEYPQVGLLKTCRELGVEVVAYSPLARGLVTGRYTSPDDFEEEDFRRTIPKYSKENFPKILKIVDALREIGNAHNATPGQVTLAWLLAQGNDIIPIPGTKKVKYLEENINSVDVTLTREEIDKVRKIAEEANAISGNRYGDGMMEAVLADTPPLQE